MPEARGVDGWRMLPVTHRRSARLFKELHGVIVRLGDPFDVLLIKVRAFSAGDFLGYVVAANFGV